MDLSLGPSDWAERMWGEIYDRARKKGKVRHVSIDGWDFEYALVNSDDQYTDADADSEYDYDEETINFWIKEFEGPDSQQGLNFASSKAFVFEKAVPSEFLDYVGLHEFIEAEGQSHALACYVELTALINKDPELFPKFASWILSFQDRADRENLENNFFGKAVPEFIDYFMSTEDDPTEVLKNFYQTLEAQLIQELDLKRKRDFIIEAVRKRILGQIPS